MAEAIKITTFVDIIFVILLMLSGTVGGISGEVIYYLAFLLPIAVGFYASHGLKRKREEMKGVAELPETLFHLNLKDIKRLFPLVCPFVTVIFMTSLLTSLALSAFGISSPDVESTGIARMLLVHAVAPALFEEALFRYIPMKLLLPYSKRSCILYSALFFALIHCSFSKMPYAFVAGVLFMFVDVAFESVWPSVILHFINNTASVILIKYCGDTLSSWIFIGMMLGLTALSVPFIYRHRSEYRAMLGTAILKGERTELTYAPIALTVICCYIAAASVFM